MFFELQHQFEKIYWFTFKILLKFMNRFFIQRKAEFSIYQPLTVQLTLY
mgnify:CR=1 FL=1